MFDYSPDDLIENIKELLQKHSGGLPEYELIRLLYARGYTEFSTGAANNLALFRTHFLLMHCLYRLRDRLRADGRAELVVDPVNIRLAPFQTGKPGVLGEDPVRAYYLDLAHLANTTAEHVEDLLRRFAHRLYSDDERKAALDILGLDESASKDAIQKRYRKLAMIHHPDRGGDEEKLKTIHEAMRILVV